MKPKPADITIILLSLALTIFAGYMAFSGTGAQVLVQGPEQTWVFPIDADETIKVKGILGGDTVLRIHGGEVWAESSPCKNQTCVSMGRINSNSLWAWIACLPNNVFVMIEGSYDNAKADATAW